MEVKQSSLRVHATFLYFFQVHRKSVKRGFEFTLMVVGETGLGKSTLVNSLFLSDLYADRKIPPVEERVKRTTELQKTTMVSDVYVLHVNCITKIQYLQFRQDDAKWQCSCDTRVLATLQIFVDVCPVSHLQDIEEKGVKLRLTVVDTPGFGDLLEGDDSWKACVKYVDDQFAAFFDVRQTQQYRSEFWRAIRRADYNSLPLFSGRKWSKPQEYRRHAGALLPLLRAPLRPRAPAN